MPARRILTLLAAPLLLLAGCLSNPDESTDPLGEDHEPAVARAAHDYVAGDAEGNFTIPGEGSYDLRVRFVPTDTCGEEAVRLTLVDPSGAVFLDEYSTPGTEVDAIAGCGGQARSGIALAPGEWTVLYRGTSPVTGIVEVERVA